MTESTPGSETGDSSFVDTTAEVVQPRLTVTQIATNPWIIAIFLVVIGSQLFSVVWSVSQQTRSAETDSRFLAKLQEILSEIRTERSRPAPNFEPIRTKAASIGQEVVQVLKAEASRKSPEKQHLLWAARDDLPRMLNEDLSTASKAEAEFETHLLEAAKLIEIKNRNAGSSSPK